MRTHRRQPVTRALVPDETRLPGVGGADGDASAHAATGCAALDTQIADGTARNSRWPILGC
jgi:hypothetical protein